MNEIVFHELFQMLKEADENILTNQVNKIFPATLHKCAPCTCSTHCIYHSSENRKAPKNFPPKNRTRFHHSSGSIVFFNDLKKFS